MRQAINPTLGPKAAVKTPDGSRRRLHARRRAKTVWEVARDTIEQASNDDIMRLGAALAFYAALSLAPLIIVVVYVAELFWTSDSTRAELLRQVRFNMGPAAVETVQNILAHRNQPSGWAAIIGIGTLLLGSTVAFANLQASLNTIWNVEPKPGREIRGWLRKRLVSLATIFMIGLMLLASVVFTSVMNGIAAHFDGLTGSLALWQTGSLVGSLAVYTLVFALMFQYLPDAKVRWRDVWIGAVATAVLFTIGKELLGLYLGRAGIGSAYGAAGSFVLLLTWLYYSSIIIFLGAEFTQVYACRRGERIQPARHAVRVERRLVEQPA